MHLGLPHQSDVGIAQPAAEGRDGAAVGPERVAEIVLPEDALGDEAAPAWRHIRQSAQLLHEATAETLDENDQNVGPRGQEKGVLYVVGRLGIKPSEQVGTVRLRQ